MANGMAGNGDRSVLTAWAPGKLGNGLHPAWLAFVRFCAEMRFGEIENLKIQDGLPVVAELTKKKVKFS